MLRKKWTNANRGAPFEALIEYSNRRYMERGWAVVEKQHTLCTPLRNSGGQIVSAKYETKATVDYMGRIGERPVAFEAKYCSQETIELKRVAPHQAEFMRKWTQTPGAIGFVLVSFGPYDGFVIPWLYWDAALAARDAKAANSVRFEPMGTEWICTGRASLNRNTLPAAWKVKFGNVWIDYLSTVMKLWRIHKNKL